MSPAHLDHVGSGLLDLDVGEVANDVGKDVMLRISDFVKELLGDRGLGHEASRVRRFGEEEFSGRVDLDDRESEIFVTLNLLPIGEQSTGGLELNNEMAQF